MPDPVMTRQDIYRQPATAAERGVIHKPLSTWERVYNLTAVRKVAILLLLAAAWEIYARWLNNALLFPTFGATVEAFVDGFVHGTLPLKAWKDCLRCPKFNACDEIAMAYSVTPGAEIYMSAAPPEEESNEAALVFPILGTPRILDKI